MSGKVYSVFYDSSKFFTPIAKQSVESALNFQHQLKVDKF